MTAQPTLRGAAELPGGGEMGARMRALDWSCTPVGPIADWPRSLKTAVRIILHSRYPMFIWWGKELTNFYNDSYATILGRRHPEALGGAAPEVWSDVWDVVGPQALAVLQEGHSTWNEQLLLIMERHGYPEETYFTFSYSPAPDDDGGVGGVFCACTEDTAQVLSERRLKTLISLAAGTRSAKTAEDACEMAAGVLAGNAHDLPFVLIYLLDDLGSRARLTACTGIAQPDLAAINIAETIDMASAGDCWSLTTVQTSGARCYIDDLPQRFGRLPGGPWSEPARSALVLSLTQTGQTDPAGFLVAGISPLRPFDDDYRSFLELVAGQVATAITESRAQEAEHRRAEALAELDRAKTAFFSDVSHEFRTPITLMLGPLEDLLTKDKGILKADPELGQSLELIHRNALRLLKLVNTLLDFSRIEAGRAQASFAALDLAQLTAELASVFRSAVETAGLQLRIDCPPLPEPVYVDRAQWEKIILNLLSNAFKFTFEGEIAVILRWTGDHAELSVRDTGSGIPADQLPHLFERFHRVHGARARSSEGSGIGLALVQELVRQHGGSIDVASEPGQGTTFTIRIPAGCTHLPSEAVIGAQAVSTMQVDVRLYLEETQRWLIDDPAGQTAVHDDDGADTASAGQDMGNDRSARILWADDNADMRDYVARLLGRYYRVEAVADGEAALAAVRRQPPDLVLADVMMPGLDGFALTRALRARPPSRAIPVILLSARAGEEARLEGLESDVDDYLIKPFSARELLARIAAHLRLKRLRDAATEELRASEQRFRDFAEEAADWFWEQDSELRFIYLSERYQFQARIPYQQALGKTRDQVFDASLQDPLRWQLHLADLQARRPFSDMELIWIDADGQRRCIVTSGKPRFSPAGNFLGYRGVGRDITELKRTEQALRIARQAAEAANKAKSEFLANMSHEIRTPMSAILGYADILAGQLSDPDDLQCIQTIRRNGDYLLELINEILDLSRIEAGKLEIEPSLFAPDKLIGELYSLMEVRAREKGLQFDVEFTTGLPATIESDPRRLRQILINLLGNAIKFTEHGSIKLRVGLRDDADMPYLCFDVIDTGIGIGENQQKTLFQPFSQGNSAVTREYGGSGLGLAISQRLAQLLDTCITVESRRQQGSVFSIAVATGSLAGVARIQPHLDARGTADVDRPLQRLSGRILVVDDRADIRLLIQQYLEDAGASVETAGNGEQALAAVTRAEASQQPFMAVVLDMQMPVMDGFTTARRLRKLNFKPPIIALTAHAMAGDREKCMLAGCTDYFIKPVERGALLNALIHHSRSSSDDCAGDSGISQSDAPLSGYRVLVVDDNIDAADALAQMLRLLGYQAETAYDGRSALLKAQEIIPRIVILDINLPDISGYEILKQLKNEPAHTQALFIALSGDDAIDDKAAMAGFDHWLLKPASALELVKLFPKANDVKSDQSSTGK